MPHWRPSFLIACDERASFPIAIERRMGLHEQKCTYMQFRPLRLWRMTLILNLYISIQVFHGATGSFFLFKNACAFYFTLRGPCGALLCEARLFFLPIRFMITRECYLPAASVFHGAHGYYFSLQMQTGYACSGLLLLP